MMGIGISGHFDIQTVCAKTGKVRERRSFDNMILDTGLDGFWPGEFGSPVPAIGIGNSEPTPSDTGLQNLVHVSIYNYGLSAQTIAPTAPDYVSSWKKSWRIDANKYVGTITEIGVYNWNGTACWCRALIRDENGDPSTITILADEYLDVTYTLNYHPELGDTNFQFEMNGITYNGVARRAYIGTAAIGGLSGSTGRIYSMTGAGRGGMWATQELGPITGAPSGQGVNTVLETSTQNFPYETGTYTKKCGFTWGLDRANVAGGIGSLVIDEGNPRACTQMSFTPKLPKDNTNTLSLVFALRVYRYTGATP